MKYRKLDTNVCTCKTGLPFRMALCLLVAVLFVLPMTGCQGNESRPSFAATGYMVAVVTMDIEEGNAFLNTPTTMGDLFISGRDTELPSTDEAYRKQIEDSVRDLYATITFKVKSSAVTGDSAVVSVEITAPDLSALEDSIMTVAFSDIEATERNAQLANLLLSELQYAASGESGRIVHTVRLDLKRVDETWKILNPSPIGHAIVGNITGLIIPAGDTGQY